MRGRAGLLGERAPPPPGLRRGGPARHAPGGGARGSGDRHPDRASAADPGRHRGGGYHRPDPASLLVPWLPPLNPVLQATFRRVSLAPGLLWLVTGQAVVLGLACADASTSLARARRPRLTTGRPRAAGWRGDRRPGRPRATRNSRRGTLVTEVTACSGVGETPSRR